MTDKETFTLRFEASFLAAWCAVNYSDFCIRGLQKSLEDPPVADARYLAEKAWEKREKIIGPKVVGTKSEGHDEQV